MVELIIYVNYESIYIYSPNSIVVKEKEDKENEELLTNALKNLSLTCKTDSEQLYQNPTELFQHQVKELKIRQKKLEEESASEKSIDTPIGKFLFFYYHDQVWVICHSHECINYN